MRHLACVCLSLSLLAAGFAAGNAGAADAGPAQPETYSADTRGFGKVAVTVAMSADAAGKPQSWTVYRASDAAHARVIAAKRLADLTGFGDLQVVAGDAVGGGTLIAGGPAGMWVLGMRGSEVAEGFAPTRDDLAALAKGKGELTPVTPRAYPRWLDCFDNAGAGMWVGGGGDDYDLPKDFPYLQAHGLTMCTLPPDESRLVAPGLIDHSIYDWHAAMAAKYDLAYRALLFPASPGWAWNLTPLPYIRPAPGYIANQFMEYQADAIQHVFEPNPATDGYRHDLRRRLAGSMAADPNLVGWHGCDEINEAGIPELAACADTPGMAEAWRAFLKAQGFDLATVSRLHTGDATRYTSWDDVQVPLPTDFIGWDPATCADLRGTWDVLPDPKREGRDGEWYLPDHGTGWTPAAGDDVLIEMYGKRYNGAKEVLPFWMRRTVTVAADHLAGLKYLHLGRAKSQDHFPPLFSAWINGKELEAVTKDDGTAWDQCFAVGDALHAGDNLIVLDTHGSPIPGHAFLGPKPVRPYPYMDPPENRRWYDAIDFDAHLRIHTLEDNLFALRAGDPDRPLKLMALAGLLDLSIPLCERLGAYQHDTGGAAGYWCPMSGARLSLAHGLPWSCEQGNPPATAPEMQKAITFYVRYGNDAADLVFAVPEYMDKPEIAQWIDGNIDLIHCIGKMHEPTPPVAILRSTRDSRLGYHEPWDWDLGRGGMQAVGRNFFYVDTPDLADGKVDAYRVVIDDGTVLMTDADVAGIEAYVRAGGIFIAQHHTGRDAPERADAWPIARLNGLTVVNHGQGVGGKLHFNAQQTLFPTLRGRDINGWGMVMDWRGVDRTGTGVGMEARSASPAAAAPGEPADIETIAEWANPPAGQGKIAIAARHLGKGVIITMGSTFWRDARDAGGAYREGAGAQEVIDELLSSLGVPRESWSGASDAWAEHWQSKNGVYDLYPVSYLHEDAKGEQTRDFTVALAREQAPEAVIEISAAGHPAVAATWKDGRLSLPTTTYDRMQTRVYAAPRADRARAGIEWFRWQSRIWRALPPIPADRRPETIAVPATVLALQDGWRMSPDVAPDDATAAAAVPAWAAPAAADATWRTVRLGAFATIGLPEDTVGRYRMAVTVPPAWQGKRIRLVFDAEGWFWGLVPQGRLWIDGKAAELKQPLRPGAQSDFALDVTAAAADGTLALALEVDGTRRKPGERQYKPDGVTGMFYLEADDLPVQSAPLPQPWRAARDFNAFTPVAPGEVVDFVYLETSFTLPAARPAKRVFLTSDGPLGCLVLNGHLVNTPGWMHELDISGMVTTDGTANVLRWAPGLPYSESVQHRAAPGMMLSWRP
jgi:hypothetical protein